MYVKLVRGHYLPINITKSIFNGECALAYSIDFFGFSGDKLVIFNTPYTTLLKITRNFIPAYTLKCHWLVSVAPE